MPASDADCSEACALRLPTKDVTSVRGLIKHTSSLVRNTGTGPRVTGAHA